MKRVLLSIILSSMMIGGVANAYNVILTAEKGSGDWLNMADNYPTGLSLACVNKSQIIWNQSYTGSGGSIAVHEGETKQFNVTPQTNCMQPYSLYVIFSVTNNQQQRCWVDLRVKLDTGEIHNGTGCRKAKVTFQGQDLSIVLSALR